MSVGRVLVVEDEVHSARALELYLSDLGYQVRTATCGEEALAAVTGFVPDVLLTDLLLAGPMDGIDVARELAGRFPDLAVILMSGLPASDLEPRLETLPAHRFAGKPLRLAEVGECIHQALAGRHR